MKLLDQLRREIRVRHYSIRTEHTYCDWVRRYVQFHQLKHPKDMGAAEINAYLSHLASDLNVAASTRRTRRSKLPTAREKFENDQRVRVRHSRTVRA